MGLPKISDDAKFWIFYGFALLWLAWGLVNYFFSYAFQIFLGVIILVLVLWICIVVRKSY